MKPAYLLIAAAGAAYYFRDSLSAAFSTTPAPAASVTAAQQAAAAAAAAGATAAQQAAAAAAAAAQTAPTIIDAAGVAVKYSDAQLLNQLNLIHWTGLQDIPQEQIARIDPQILSQYGATTAVNPGTALAFLLGVGGASAEGNKIAASDGHTYQMTSGVYLRVA